MTPHTSPPGDDEGQDATALRSLSYPRQKARTQGFTLGAPTSVSVSPDGRRVLFLRTRSDTDPHAGLWVADLDPEAPSLQERLLADPAALLGADEELLSEAEAAMRERARQTGAGIVGYAHDRSARLVSFALSGQPYLADTEADAEAGAVRRLPVPGPVLDPRVDPTGARVGYVRGGAMVVFDLASGAESVLAAPGSGTDGWGLAEFIAAEEMDRFRGYWWAPDGQSLLVTHVDEASVGVWHIADPAHPQRPARTLRYPAAGTANADVELHVVDLTGGRREVTWDRRAYPYLAVVRWRAPHPPLLRVQSRDQREGLILQLDPLSGATEVLHAEHDPAWLELVPGVPDRAPDGAVLRTVEDADTRRLALGDRLLTPPGLQVLAVLDVAEDGALLATAQESTQTSVHLLDWGGGLSRLSPPGPGVDSAARGGPTTVLAHADLDTDRVVTTVRWQGRPVGELGSLAAPYPMRPNLTLTRTGARRLATAVLLPRNHEPGTSMPVLMDPYGGPHVRRVLARRSAFLDSQWFADQGFAVVVCDGRGTPARGPAWERAVAGDLASAALQDQVDALEAAAEQIPDLDTDRVAIRGWSFGGYLAALAVLRRPDVFHAAVAGAPVTEWRLYDTHYTERYLGTDPDGADAPRYDACSLLGMADRLERPLMIVHGLADDNVVVAHSLRLSAALLGAGRPHSVLPLVGVTHLTPQEQVAENLLLLQVDFLRQALTR